jgi:dipeptidase E
MRGVKMRRILAIGGGGFTTEKKPSPVDAYIRELVGKSHPRICFIATPSGDKAAQIDKFHAAYGALGFETSNLSFFNGWGSNVIPYTDYQQRLLSQDAIFVGGGHLRSALAVWREWGLDAALSDAWNRGVLLAGMSAGAMCWFETGLGGPFEQGNYGLQRGLGLIQGACAAHYKSIHVPERRVNFLSEMRLGRMPPTLAIDNFAAVLLADREISKVVSWASGSTAYQVEKIDDEIQEAPLAAVQLSKLTGP